MVTREMMVTEAVKRMKALKMLEQPITEFQEGLLNLSEGIGLLYWLDDEQKKMVEEYETRHKGVVYHIIRSFTNFGEMYALLYVSPYTDEWEMDMQDLQNGETCAYVINKTMPDCSEHGYIGIKPMNGGVVREW